jgi:glutamine synthetase
MSAKDVIKFAKENKAACVDLKFMDFLGTWQHFTIPMTELSEGLFDEGSGFDGSSIRGWQPINASDMLIVPDPSTAVMDPFMQHPTLSLIGDVVDPITKEEYSRDPRHIAKKAEAYVKSSGIGDVAYFGPEPEFFILDDVRFDQNSHSGYYHLNTVEGIWNTGREEGPNLGYKPRHKEGYFPVPPTDSQQDIRQEMVMMMEKVGIVVEKQHHEVATAGQAEIDMRFAPLLKMADWLMW